MRPMRNKARALVIDALRDELRWHDELTTVGEMIESLAAREGKTERWIRRTLSLAFLTMSRDRQCTGRNHRDQGSSLPLSFASILPSRPASPIMCGPLSHCVQLGVCRGGRVVLCNNR
jgi:hypothetical protein